MLETRTVSTSYLRPLWAAVESAGIPAAALLEGMPLTLTQLSQPNTRLSIAAARQVWKRAVDLTGDTLLGLKVAERMMPSTFHVLGLATLSCATLAQAMDLTLRYQRLVSEAGLLSIQRLADGSVGLIHSEPAGKQALLPQQVEALLAGLHLQARSLTQQMIVPLAVSFRHAAQGEVQRYGDCFGLVPQFGADVNMMILSSADLQLPLPYADEALCRMNADYADRQHAALPETGYVASHAVQWMTSQNLCSVGLHDLAAALGMSVRNLQRALRAERTSWSSILDEARRTALTRLLQEGCSLDTAAQQLGYHDASSVSRAARRWFGQSPKRWLNSQTQADGIA
jgi:AraC-like DNA-binding protein